MRFTASAPPGRHKRRRATKRFAVFAVMVAIPVSYTHLYGGGIYAENGIEINNGTVSGNTAANGGGISTIGDVDFNRGFITGNTAHEDGGGIYGTLANITAGSGAVFADNSAARGYLIKDCLLYTSLSSRGGIGILIFCDEGFWF